MTAPKTVTQAEFARMQGWQRSYVTALKKEGRLVMTESGKRVRVAESLARIEETKDPNRSDVVQRHAKQRGKQLAAEQPPQQRKKGGGKGVESFTDARARKMSADANLSEYEERKRLGELCESADVRAGGAEAGTIVRAVLENLADEMSAVLFQATDESDLRRMLLEAIEAKLQEISGRAEKAVQRIMEADV